MLPVGYRTVLEITLEIHADRDKLAAAEIIDVRTWNIRSILNIPC